MTKNGKGYAAVFTVAYPFLIVPDPDRKGGMSMKRRGFLYNSTICISCCACQVACQSTKGLRPDEYFRRVVIRSKEGSQGIPFSGGCNHCAKPACVAACPTGAMYRDEEAGVVLHDDGRCIGCGACVWNCPYGAVSLSATTGVSQKCDSCIQLRRKGLQPACVAACPMGALRYDGPVPVEVERPWRQLQANFLPSPTETNPSTFAWFAEEEEDGHA